MDFEEVRGFDRDVTFMRVLAVTRKWNVAVVYLHLLYNKYALKTGKFTYNCITTMNFKKKIAITKFCLCTNVEKVVS